MRSVAAVVAIALFTVVVMACRSQPPPPAIFVPPAPSSPSSAPAPPAPEPALRALPQAPPVVDDPLLDLEAAPRVAIKAAPNKAGAPKPIGTRPAKTRALKETAKVKDGSALERAEAPTKYDPKLPYEFHRAPTELPREARRDIPLAFRGAALTVISESGGKLLLIYGNQHVAVVDGRKVEEMVDFNPSELPLTDLDRSGSDVHQVVYRDGVLFVCRGYNAWFPTRKGIVTAVAATTGELRWRSESKVCGGVLALVNDDYIITGYGAADTPYALKLLRRFDGTLTQSVTLFGAALEFAISGNTIITSTYKHRVTYELLP